MNWYIGTMGFSYKDWSGVLYPQDMTARNYLSYYSRIFNAAEIDSTFYGTPKADTVQRWAAVTPDGFKFCVKVPRAITHDLILAGAASDLMQEFTATMRLLGDKLGVILFQFPPSYDVSQLPALDAFLAQAPAGFEYAVEVRDRSWHQNQEDVLAVLRSHGVCWAATEYPGLPDRIHVTADFLYVRWIGQHGSFEHHTHERIDRTTELSGWLQRLQPLTERVRAIYGFFNNDYAGFAPGTANRFKALAGLPSEPLLPPQQATLF